MTGNKNSINEVPNFHGYRVTARLLESREYIQKVRENESLSETSKRALVEGWFGVKSKDMTRRIVAYLYLRYSNYPLAIKILKFSNDTIDMIDFRMISHFHLLLADPYYRWLTGVYLPSRKQDGFKFVSQEEVIYEFSKIVKSELEPITMKTYCSKLLTTARDVGLLNGKTKKEFEEPVLTERAMLYIFLIWQSMSLPMSDFIGFAFYKSVLNEDSFIRILERGLVQDFWHYQIKDGYFSCSISMKKAEEEFGVVQC
jgi:hypothetical protein